MKKGNISRMQSGYASSAAAATWISPDVSGREVAASMHAAKNLTFCDRVHKFLAQSPHIYLRGFCGEGRKLGGLLRYRYSVDAGLGA
jgi:hypothetical protein